MAEGGVPLCMILVPGCSQEHAHGCLELSDYGHCVRQERLVGVHLLHGGDFMGLEWHPMRCMRGDEDGVGRGGTEGQEVGEYKRTNTDRWTQIRVH